MSLKPTSIPTKTLAASITALSSTFKLNNILGWDGVSLDTSDFGTQAYCVFRNANRSRIELMEFDPATVADTSITILRRGLQFDGDLTTEVTANKFAWTKGDTFVDMGTDAPQVFQWMKEYIDAASIAGAVPASTVAAGIVEESTYAETIAGTAAGGTGARLFVNPSNMHYEAKTLVPKPNFPTGDGSNAPSISTTVSSNTTALLGQVIVPFKITVNKVSFRTGAVTTPDTADISMYTEDGQTQIFSFTTATLAASTLTTTTITPVTIYPGIYYTMINPNGSLNAVIYAWYANSAPFDTGFLKNVTSEPVLAGTLTITAGTPPTTFDPTAITFGAYGGPTLRLDN